MNTQAKSDPVLNVYLPISIVLATFILAGTLIFVGGLVNTKITELTTAVNALELKVVNEVSEGTNSGNNIPGPTQPTEPEQPKEIDVSELIESDDPVLGDSNAPVTIIEFSDFECPFCARAYNDSIKKIEENFIKEGKVKIVFKHFPLSFHPNAQKAAEAAICAGDQDLFWEMHNWLFENNTDLSVANIKKYATTLSGLNAEKFNACLDNGDSADKVSRDMAKANIVGVKGTPTFVINGEPVVGALPFDVFKQVIEAKLAN